MAPDDSPEDRARQLLLLMGVDANAERSYRIYSLLESLINQNRKSAMDVLFGIIGSITGVINYLTLLQVPKTAPWVALISGIVFAGIAVLWWRARKAGYEMLLENMRKFGEFLDQSRRLFREFQLAASLRSSEIDLKDIRETIRGRLVIALGRLEDLFPYMDDMDYKALGENKGVILAEIKKARDVVDATPV